MKKLLLSSALLFGVCFGLELDTSKTQNYWVGYKFTNKTAVKGGFKDVAYKFGKGTGIGGVLTGATAKINTDSVITGNPASEKNLTKGFFEKFLGKDIKVRIERVLEGENQGAILAKVTMNKKSQLVPMQYEIKEGNLVAKGVIDVLSFKLDEAYKNLSETCKPFHKGVTWSEVEIGFVIPTK